jgi:hypothetical protein
LKGLGALAFLLGFVGAIVSFTSGSAIGAIVLGVIAVPGLWLWVTNVLAMQPSHFPKKLDYTLRVKPPVFAESETREFEDNSFS